MKETDRAWAAGFFDGEGHTQALRVRNKYYPVLAVVQVDRAGLDRFHQIVGCGQIYGPYKMAPDPRGYKRQPRRDWKATGCESVCWAIQILWPYLGLTKRRQFIAAMEKVQMSFPDKNQGVVPDQFDPRNRGARPLFVLDLNPAPPQAVPSVGPSGDGADARSPETAKLTGACNYVPMPDNTGPTTNGGTSLGENYGR